ncbi:uncharacterized protein EV420DRAFT_192016 [Desarmillaria tabescens]|uniref:C2H2-type domain-containing protein n=1 Tax=Armillaria tabescens TaxID=1929756 RepID=A0AA39N940_ARMTA|nr:uncharacterized protein EV420DRAFT_192016 [Desarmillaria tabescens]KAK0461300.1 hypothetical protein EV420DRAFT_192016 [Desarmillaria tabescens]
MSYSSGKERHSRERPTLPPIRDLFGDELSRSAKAPHDSPPLTLARLSMSDDDHEVPPRTSSYPGSGAPYNAGRNSMFQSSAQYVPPASRPYHDPPTTFYNHQQSSSTSSYTTPAFSKTRSSDSIYGNQPGRPSLGARSSSHMSSSTSTASPNRFPVHRNTVPQMDYPHSYGMRFSDSRRDDFSRQPAEDRLLADRHPSGENPATRYPFDQRPSANTYPSSDFPSRAPGNAHPPRPWAISTSVDRSRADDDDPTPTARYRDVGPSFGRPPERDDELMSASASKYECTYCGKGFNRPSSLKIHINSHTGEKPFVCPVESCGRSFSVLSNMRRHARVHTQTPSRQQELSSDESSEIISPPQSASSQSSGALSVAPSQSHWQHRRDSSASASSTSSRRSRSVSSDDFDETDDQLRPEKRTRRHLK